MFKAELVVYLLDQSNGNRGFAAYATKGFRQASVVGSSSTSYEKALDDAYDVALAKYNVTRKQIDLTKLRMKKRSWANNIDYGLS